MAPASHAKALFLGGLTELRGGETALQNCALLVSRGDLIPTHGTAIRLYKNPFCCSLNSLRISFTRFLLVLDHFSSYAMHITPALLACHSYLPLYRPNSY